MAYRYNLDDIGEAARGQWSSILKSILGLSDLQLSKKGQPCPICGGTDRYSFTDRHGRGDYYCRGCGPGNGWTLIKKKRSCDFPEAIMLVGEYLGY